MLGASLSSLSTPKHVMLYSYPEWNITYEWYFSGALDLIFWYSSIRQQKWITSFKVKLNCYVMTSYGIRILLPIEDFYLRRRRTTVLFLTEWNNNDVFNLYLANLHVYFVNVWISCTFGSSIGISTMIHFYFDWDIKSENVNGHQKAIKIFFLFNTKA